MAMRMTETRRRRRDAAPPAGGEAYYRDMLLQLQSEFARVVAALETRAMSLEQLNEELQTEVTTLRDELSAAHTREMEAQTIIQQAEEQAAMAREDSAGQTQELQAQIEELTTQWQQQEIEWNAERTKQSSEYERVARDLRDATAQLAQEQQRNAHMSQEIQLLECRVDAAVKTSRSFETRLQQLQQLKKDEKHDLEAQVQHLKARLDDKKEQNRYLAEALMDKEARRAARKDRETRTSDASMASNDVTMELRKRAAVKETSTTTKPTTKTSRSYQLPDMLDKKKQPTHRYAYGGSPLSEFLEDLQSQAPTSPTSSSSPTRSPRSLASSRTTTAPTATTTTRTHRTTTTTSRLSPSPPPRQETSVKTKTTTRSDRLQREMALLRRKFDACQQMTTGESLSPR